MTTLRFNGEERKQIVSEARGLALRLLRLIDVNDTEGGTCLLEAAAVVRVLQKRGVRALLQAGTAMFRRVPREKDDGVQTTHFSYVFDQGDELHQVRLQSGKLPEMHCWAAISGDPGEIIDTTAGNQPELCRRLHGRDWLAPPPPDHYWFAAGSSHPDVVYQPDTEAIRIALQFLHSIAGGLRT